MNLMAASVAVDFFHHWIFAAYDMWVRFVAMVTIRLLNWRCLRAFRMVQAVVVLVVRRSRLRLLTWLPIVLLVSVAAPARMVFGRIFSLKIADHTTVEGKFSSCGMGRGAVSRPTVTCSELGIQIIQRTHSGDLCLIGIWIGWCHDIVVVIANVDNRWIGLTFLVERDLCVTTGGRKLGIPEQVRSTCDGGLCRVQPLNTVRSQTPPTNVIHNVRVNVINIVRYTIACIGFKFSRSELNGLTIINVATVVVDVAIVTTAIIGTECAGRIEEPCSVMIQTAAYGIRLNMLTLRLLLLLMVDLLLLLLTVAYYWLLLLMLLMLLLLLLGNVQLRIAALSGSLWWCLWRWLRRDLRQVVMILHVGVRQDSTAGETVRYVRKQPMMFHRGDCGLPRASRVSVHRL